MSIRITEVNPKQFKDVEEFKMYLNTTFFDEQLVGIRKQELIEILGGQTMKAETSKELPSHTNSLSEEVIPPKKRQTKKKYEEE